MADGIWRRLFGRGRPAHGSARVEIDGVIHEDVRHVKAEGATLTVDGKVVGGSAGRIVTIRVLQGTLGRVDSTGDVMALDVAGDINARGDVHCENVGGSVKAGRDVTCGSIGGGIVAGGDVIGGSRR